MIPGDTYYVSWLEERSVLGLSHAALTLEDVHPSGMFLFVYADGFGSVRIRPQDVMGYQLAEVNR